MTLPLTNTLQSLGASESDLSSLRFKEQAFEDMIAALRTCDDAGWEAAKQRFNSQGPGSGESLAGANNSARRISR